MKMQMQSNDSAKMLVMNQKLIDNIRMHNKFEENPKQRD